jgi:transcriptional regulator with XRE-family HTH domain
MHDVADQSIERAAMLAAGRVKAGVADDIVRHRTDAGISRAELARAAGVDPAYLRRIEAAVVSPSLDTYARLAVALGDDLALRLYPNTGPAIRDRFQSAIAEGLLSQAHPRWHRFAEIAVRRPSRGWIDLGLFDPRPRVFVAVEIQSELRRLEQLIRWSAEKAASLPSWDGFSQLGGEITTSQLLIVRDTRATRAVGREFRRLFRAAYPGDPVDALASLEGTAAWPGAAVLWATGPAGDEQLRLAARP